MTAVRAFAGLLLIAAAISAAQVSPRRATAQETLPAQSQLNLPFISSRVAGPFYLSVPYRIEAPHPDLRIIQIKCMVWTEPLGTAIGYGQGTVQIDGKPAQGIVDVFFKPYKHSSKAEPESLEDARYYDCGLVVSNGLKVEAATVESEYSRLIDAEPWRVSQPGSVLRVTGTVEF